MATLTRLDGVMVVEDQKVRLRVDGRTGLVRLSQFSPTDKVGVTRTERVSNWGFGGFVGWGVTLEGELENDTLYNAYLVQVRDLVEEGLEGFAGHKSVEIDLDVLEVNRNCNLRGYAKRETATFDLNGAEITTFISPDCTYKVVKEAIQSAKHKLFVSLYDFTTPYMADLLVERAQAGVQVTLMLDDNGRTGSPQIITRIRNTPNTTFVSAASCANPRFQFFPSYH